MKVELSRGKSFTPFKNYVPQSVENYLWETAKISAQKIVNADLKQENAMAIPVVDEPVTLIIERGDNETDILDVVDVLNAHLAYTEVYKETGLFLKKRTRVAILGEWRDQYIVH